eukprot:1194124-Prorocentrum_minimum.AAC.3
MLPTYQIEPRGGGRRTNSSQEGGGRTANCWSASYGARMLPTDQIACEGFGVTGVRSAAVR